MLNIQGIFLTLTLALALAFSILPQNSIAAGDKSALLDNLDSPVKGDGPEAVGSSVPKLEQKNDDSNAGPQLSKEDAAAKDGKQDESVAREEGDSEGDGWEQASFPGITNKRILVDTEGKPHVSLWYPELGNSVIDADILKFVESEAKAFNDEAAELSDDGEDKSVSDSSWDLSGIFFVEHPSERALSVTFNTYIYSGGAHGNIGIDCLNYDLVNNRRLEFADLFKNPEAALELMSRLTAGKLVRSLGEDADDEMIAEGTSPTIENFKNLTLIANGVYVEFQPYQVGPWSIGPQRVELSLEELAPAGPNPNVWNIPPSAPPAQ